MGFPRRIKDPDAVLDFPVDWSSWLPDGDTIESATVTAETGIVVDSFSVVNSGTAVVAWLSGGTTDERYVVTYHIVTVEGREDDRSITVVIRER